jgi:tetratricopeptide (TPR) repeat protein
MNFWFPLVMLMFTAVRGSASPCSGAEEQLRAARMLAEQRRFADAIRTLSDLESPYAQCPEIPLLKGQLLSVTGQEVQARAQWEKASKLAPNDAAVQFEIGSDFDSTNHPRQAVGAFRKVVALEPANPRAFDYLALNLERLGEIDEVERLYRRGLEVNQGRLFDAFLDYNYGRFLMKLNRLEESRLHLDKAVTLAPETRAVYYERARLLTQMRRYAEARPDAERALSLPDPGQFILDLQVYYLLSAIYRNLGEQQLAETYGKLSREAKVPVRTLGRQ